MLLMDANLGTELEKLGAFQLETTKESTACFSVSYLHHFDR